MASSYTRRSTKNMDIENEQRRETKCVVWITSLFSQSVLGSVRNIVNPGQARQKRRCQPIIKSTSSRTPQRQHPRISSISSLSPTASSPPWSSSLSLSSSSSVSSSSSSSTSSSHEHHQHHQRSNTIISILTLAIIVINFFTNTQCTVAICSILLSNNAGSAFVRVISYVCLFQERIGNQGNNKIRTR